MNCMYGNMGESHIMAYANNVLPLFKLAYYV